MSRTGRCGRPARRRRSRRSPPPSPGSGRRIARWSPALQRGAREPRRPSMWTPRSWRATRTRPPWPTTGRGGYQPVVVLWAEQDVILHDQFRDGHVPAGCGNVRVLEQAVANLPQGITQIRLRADSALYETDVLRWCEARQIAYAISADLSEQLRAEIRPAPGDGLAGGARGRRRRSGAWAEVPYVPDDGDYRKDRPCVRRYLAVAHPEAPGGPLRRREQRPLLRRGDQPRGRRASPSSSGTGRRPAPWSTPITSSRTSWRPPPSPAGSSGRTPPGSGSTSLTYNLLTALKRLTLPGDLRTARPKRLRFLLFNTVGKVVAHARRTLLRLTGVLQHALLVRVRRRIAALAPA